MRLHNAYSVYLMMRGASSVSFALIATVNLVYQADVVGLNPLQLVLVGTLLEAVCFLLEVPTGIVADLYSRRLSVVIGFCLEGAGFIVEGSIPRFAAVLAAQVVWGAGATLISGADAAWIADEIGEATAGRAYLRGSQVGQVFGVVGVLGSVALASIHLSLPVVVGGCMLVALGICLGFTMPERGFSRHERAGDHSPWREMARTFHGGRRAIRLSPVVTTIVVATAFAGAASEGFDRLWQVHFLRDFSMPSLGPFKPVVWFGVFSLGAAPLGIAAAEIARRRLDFDDRSAVAHALVLLTSLRIAAVAVFGLVGSFPLAVAALWSGGAVWAAYGPIATAWLNQNVDSRVRATVLSMESQVNALGQIAGGPVIGAIGTIASLRAAIVAAGAALTPLLVLYGRMRRADPLAAEEVEAIPGA